MPVDFGTLAGVLEHHIDQGALTRKAIELAAGVSHSTSARWVDPEQPTWPTAEKLQAMLSAGRLPPAVQADMLSWLMAFSPFAAVRRHPHDAAELDANHDGRVDCLDAMRHAIEAQRHAIELAELLARAIEDRRVDARELQALRAKAGEVADAMDSAMEAAARDRGQAQPRARRPR